MYEWQKKTVILLCIMRRYMRTVYILMVLLALVGCSGGAKLQSTDTQMVARVAKSASVIATASDTYWADPALWYQGSERLSHVDTALPDVFYFLPTCVMDWTDSLGTVHHNANPRDPRHVVAWSLSAQLADTIFATRANLFLPYYRQATFGGLQGSAAPVAGALAVTDALQAFDYYLKHHNGGRPFILAGYSQGGLMVKEALKHMADSTYKRLVAAYVVGYSITAADTMVQKGHALSHVRLAADSVSRGVTICFNSVTSASAISPLLCQGNVACINPISWTTSATPATLLSAGAKPTAADTRFPYGTAVMPADATKPVTVSVDPVRHVLMVSGIDAGRYTFAGLKDFFPEGNLHLQELFFYAPYLRHNVLLRSGVGK